MTAVQVRDAPERRRVEAFVDEELAGYLMYRRADRQVTLVHTEIKDRFSGRGIGGALVRAALDAARSDGLTVEVVCPFVAGWVRRHPEYHDVAGAG